MCSTRLPGKAMMDIFGKPMLGRVIDRIKRCKSVSEVIVATTTESSDERIERYCAEQGIGCYRGSQDNVLDRYYKASKLHTADAIVRITSDCPLIDPVITDRVISAYVNNNQKYLGASNVIKRTFPRGLDTEVFSFNAIEYAWKNAKDKPHLEHVTKYLYENEKEKILSVENPRDYSSYRWTVDELDDLRFARSIYEGLSDKEGLFLMNDIIDFLAKNKELLKINENVKQKEEGSKQ
jgi:spore coat polysaccharide biosynthesis protein SpsF